MTHHSDITQTSISSQIIGNYTVVLTVFAGEEPVVSPWQNTLINTENASMPSRRHEISRLTEIRQIFISSIDAIPKSKVMLSKGF